MFMAIPYSPAFPRWEQRQSCRKYKEGKINDRKLNEDLFIYFCMMGVWVIHVPSMQGLVSEHPLPLYTLLKTLHRLLCRWATECGPLGLLTWSPDLFPGHTFTALHYNLLECFWLAGMCSWTLIIALACLDEGCVCVETSPLYKGKICLVALLHFLSRHVALGSPAPGMWTSS